MGDIKMYLVINWTGTVLAKFDYEGDAIKYRDTLSKPEEFFITHLIDFEKEIFYDGEGTK